MSLLNAFDETPNDKESDLLYRLMQAQQIVAAIVEKHGTQKEDGKELRITFTDLQKVMMHPAVDVQSDRASHEVVLFRANA